MRNKERWGIHSNTEYEILIYTFFLFPGTLVHCELYATKGGVYSSGSFCPPIAIRNTIS